jgi:hypothetical protein
MDDEQIGYLIGKFLGEGALKSLSVATYVAWPAEAGILLYIFIKKYYKNKAGVAGFSREELEEDLVWADMKVQELKKEKKKVEDRIKKLSQKSDLDTQSRLRTAKYELASIEKRMKDLVNRRELDTLLLIILEHRKELEEKGIWENMQVPKKFQKKIDKEMKRIEKEEINFDEFSGYLRMKLEESINQ